MPARNTVKEYRAYSFYHVYNRGAGGRAIFFDEVDRKKFLSLLQRHILPPENDGTSKYPIYNIQLAAYCLMGNHFHLLLYQEEDPHAITGFMRSVSTAYSMYFNARHKEKGHLFQGIYKASHISSDSYLLHITRYIHLNPQTYLTYRWSSLRYYLGESSPLVRHENLPSFSPDEYKQFLEEYTDRRQLLKEIKSDLAL